MGEVRSGGGMWERLGLGVGFGRYYEWGWDVGEVRSRVAFGRG